MIGNFRDDVLRCPAALAAVRASLAQLDEALGDQLIEQVRGRVSAASKEVGSVTMG
jgi:hypothetical protein